VAGDQTTRDDARTIGIEREGKKSGKKEKKEEGPGRREGEK
jgi:hypothetical protein